MPDLLIAFAYFFLLLFLSFCCLLWLTWCMSGLPMTLGTRENQAGVMEGSLVGRSIELARRKLLIQRRRRAVSASDGGWRGGGGGSVVMLSGTCTWRHRPDKRRGKITVLKLPLSLKFKFNRNKRKKKKEKETTSLFSPSLIFFLLSMRALRQDNNHACDMAMKASHRAPIPCP